MPKCPASHRHEFGISTCPPLPGAEPTVTGGVTRGEQHRYYVEPASFTTLKRGGAKYGFQAEAIVYNGGNQFAEPDQEPRPLYASALQPAMKNREKLNPFLSLPCV